MIHPEIMLGENPCRHIKNIFFQSEASTPELTKRVAVKFTELKNILRKNWVGIETIPMLQELNKYSEDEIRDIYTQDAMEENAAS